MKEYRNLNSHNSKLAYLKHMNFKENKHLLEDCTKYIFDFNASGIPNETEGEIFYTAYHMLLIKNQTLAEKLLFHRFQKGNEERYRQYIEPNMVKLLPDVFTMGGEKESVDQYLGETPQHAVTLSPYFVSKIPVTEALYTKFNPKCEISGGENMPMVNITWFDAVMFAEWVGCRLLTEAEWEYASRGGQQFSWCCQTESELESYGWFSQNAQGSVKPTALLKPNQFGLYDMHGNVWEWCLDNYDENYYRCSPKTNPINLKLSDTKVCRGGSINAFSEMCRCAFRYNEPTGFKAFDLGFRLAKTINF